MASVTASEALIERLGEPGLLLVDVRPREAWAEATIPGARLLNVYDYFIPHSDEAGLADIGSATRRALTAAGLDRGQRVVYFEEETGMISPRGLWFHEFVGLDGGQLLDGGFRAWTAAGGPTAPGRGAGEAITSTDAGTAAQPLRREMIALLGDVLDRDPATTDLLDVRRRSEFDGTFAHPCCDRAGRIPDAKFLFWEDLLANGRYRSPGEIAALARASGLDPAREVITYCHRGARAATAYYALKDAGYPRVRVFVGSWHEWAARSDLPIATGAGTAQPA